MRELEINKNDKALAAEESGCNRELQSSECSCQGCSAINNTDLKQHAGLHQTIKNGTTKFAFVLKINLPLY